MLKPIEYVRIDTYLEGIVNHDNHEVLTVF